MVEAMKRMAGLETLNKLSVLEMVNLLANVVEHTPKV